MRSALAQLFVDAVKNNNRTYVLSGDHGYALFDPLKTEYPEHFINAGVAEQNMVGIAAGLAKGGFFPVVYGLGAFVPNRVLEQIKLDVCYEQLQVIFIGDGAGAVYSTLGISHQTFEDIAVLRSLPNIRIFSPSDSKELAWCFGEALHYQGPSFIRVGKSDLAESHCDASVVHATGLTLIKQGDKDKPIILATGAMVSVCNAALDAEFAGISLYSVCKIKPMNERDLCFIRDNSSFVVTVEEHNVLGGLGSVVAEIVTTHFPKKVVRIGVEDCFTQACGSYEYAMDEHGLSKNKIRQKFAAIFKAPEGGCLA